MHLSLTEKEFDDYVKNGAKSGIKAQTYEKWEIVDSEKGSAEKMPQKVQPEIKPQFGAGTVGAAQMSVYGAIEQLLTSSLSTEDMDSLREENLIDDVIYFVTADEKGAILSEEVNSHISKDSIGKINSIKDSFSELKNKGLADEQLINEIVNYYGFRFALNP